MRKPINQIQAVLIICATLVMLAIAFLLQSYYNPPPVKPDCKSEYERGLKEGLNQGYRLRQMEQLLNLPPNSDGDSGIINE